MGIIKIPMRFEGSKDEKTLHVLFDISAAFSCMDAHYANEIGKVYKMRTPLAAAIRGTNFKFKEVLLSDFYYNGIRMSDEFMVVANLGEAVIIGATTIRKWRIKLDFENDTVIIDPKVAWPILIDLRPAFGYM